MKGCGEDCLRPDPPFQLVGSCAPQPILATDRLVSQQAERPDLHSCQAGGDLLHLLRDRAPRVSVVPPPPGEAVHQAV